MSPIDLASLRNLTVDEKLQIVTVLWGDIATSDVASLLTDEQLKEIERRSNQLSGDSSIAIDEEELGRRVNG